MNEGMKEKQKKDEERETGINREKSGQKRKTKKGRREKGKLREKREHNCMNE